MNSVASALA